MFLVYFVWFFFWFFSKFSIVVFYWMLSVQLSVIVFYLCIESAAAHDRPHNLGPVFVLGLVCVAVV